MRFSYLPLISSLAWISGCAGCDKAPPEPTGNVVEHKKPARCIRKTNPAPPRPVPKGPDPRCPRDADGGPPKVPHGTLEFVDAKGKPKVDAEIMRSEAERNRGLMYRKQLAESAGMIFEFGGEKTRTFWMHNTCLPLDMLFVAADGMIVGILENMPTMNDRGRSIPCPAKYVIEVNAGYCRRHGIVAGQKVKLP